MGDHVKGFANVEIDRVHLIVGLVGSGEVVTVEEKLMERGTVLGQSNLPAGDCWMDKIVDLVKYKCLYSTFTLS